MTNKGLYAPEYPLAYTGPTTKGGLMYDDWCRVVQELPHGSQLGRHTFIGHWVMVEVYPEEDGSRYVVPRSTLAPRKD